MQLTPPKSWKQEFARSTEAERYREIVRRAQEEAKKKERDEDKKDREADLDDMAELAVMATSAEVYDFTVRADHYDSATYEALRENEILVDLLTDKYNDMLGKAYVLPDGTKVFESTDGVRVFDVNGVELDPEMISADDIEDWRPKYEELVPVRDDLKSALEERNELFQFQQQLDEAREQVKEGEISQEDLKEIEDDLAASMPDRVRNHLAPEFQPELGVAPEPDAEPDNANQPQRPAFRAGGNLDLTIP